MKQPQTLYKVVTDDLQSVVMNRNNIYQFVVQYSETDFVGGVNGSKVFCFSDLDEAKEFCDTFAHVGRIYEVEVIGIPVAPKQVSELAFKSITEFWRLKKAKKSTDALFTSRPLHGTVLVDKVKLVKRIPHIS